jgi:hypothetical protein
MLNDYNSSTPTTLGALRLKYWTISHQTICSSNVKTSCNACYGAGYTWLKIPYMILKGK